MPKDKPQRTHRVEPVALTLPEAPLFAFWPTVLSHGWFDLLPFQGDLKARTLEVALETRPGRVVRARLEDPATPGSMPRVTLTSSARITAADLELAGRKLFAMLRLDEDLAPFYARLAGEPRLAWVVERRAGRLLRGASAWEDLVKVLLTTNCSWALTRSMTRNLVEALGPGDDRTGRAFPGPATMAAQSERFYRETVRAGYRSPFLVELAGRVAAGRLDPERWRTGELPPDVIEAEIRSIKGAGTYAIGSLLKLLSRYESLALDSWCRAKWKRLRGMKQCSDRTIERAFRPFGPWQGLALWMELTADWFEAEGWEPK